MRTSEVLYRAADLIEERGWGQGTWKNVPGEPLCVEGAIQVAMGIDAVELISCPARSAVRLYLGGEAPFIWNDGLFHDRVSELIAADEPPRRSYQDLQDQALREGAAKVVAVLRATAVIEASKESDLSDADLEVIAGQFGGDVIDGRLFVEMAGEVVTFVAHEPKAQVSA